MEPMPPGLQEEIAKWITSTLLSLFQQFDPHAAVIGIFLTLLLPLENYNRRTRGFIAFLLTSSFAWLLDAGAPKPTWAALPAATKGGCVGGFAYLWFDDWLEAKLRLRSNSLVLSCCLLLLDPFGVRLAQAPESPYTQEDLESAASESEMTVEEYMFWLIEKRTEESQMQLDQAIHSAEAKNKEAATELKQAVKSAEQIRAEIEGIKKEMQQRLKGKK